MYYQFNADGELIAKMQYSPIIDSGRVVSSEEVWEVGVAKLIEDGDTYTVDPNFYLEEIAVLEANQTYLNLLNEASMVIKGLSDALAENYSESKTVTLDKWKAYLDDLFRMDLSNTKSIVWPPKPLLFGS